MGLRLVNDPRFLSELLLLIAIAAAGVALFERLRLPAVAGFLVMGALVGVGLMIFLRQVTGGDQTIWTIGLIPFLIGVILAIFGRFIVQKPKPPHAS